jgi:hypothetical protein
MNNKNNPILNHEEKISRRFQCHITDAKQNLVIYVKPEDIAGAICRDHEKCVVAKAIMRQRASTTNWVDVGASVVLIGTGPKTGRRYFLPSTTRQQIRFFDDHDGRFAPCVVELRAPPVHRKLGARAGLPSGTPKRKSPRKRQIPTR